MGDGQGQDQPPLVVPFVRTLLVNFDAARAVWLERLLRRHGHEVRTADATTDWRPSHPEVDLILVKVDDTESSLAVCRAIRAVEDVALIAVSGLNTEQERLRALQAGCDDHLYWWCGPVEVMARIDAVLRWARPARDAEPDRIVHGALHIDTHRREVRLAGEVVHLTNKEYELLRLLAARDGAVVSRAEIMRLVWGAVNPVIDGTLDTHVSSLRRKVGRWACVTVKGYGLRLGTPPDTGA